MYLTRFVGYVIISEWWKPKSHECITWPTLFVSFDKDFFWFPLLIIFTFVSILCEIEPYSAKLFGAISDTREFDHSTETIISLSNLKEFLSKFLLRF